MEPRNRYQLAVHLPLRALVSHRQRPSSAAFDSVSNLRTTCHECSAPLKFWLLSVHFMRYHTGVPHSRDCSAEVYGLRAIANALTAASAASGNTSLRNLAPLLLALEGFAAPAAADEPDADNLHDPKRQATALLQQVHSSSGSARHRVLGSGPLLTHIFSFVGGRRWLWIASVGPIWRGAYMAACADHFGCGALCKTHVRLAASSAAGFMFATDGEAATSNLFELLPEAVGRWGDRLVLNCFTGIEFQHSSSVSSDLVLGAAKSGRLEWFDRVFYARERHQPLGLDELIRCAIGAAKHGDDGSVLSNIAYECTQWPLWLCTLLSREAAYGGHLVTVRWLLDASFDHFGDIIDESNDVVEVDENGSGLLMGQYEDRLARAAAGDGTFAEFAIASANLDLLQYLVSDRAHMFFSSDVALAMRHGHVEAVKFLLQRGGYADDVLPCQTFLMDGGLCELWETPIALYEWAKSSGLFTWDARELSSMLTKTVTHGCSAAEAWLREQGAVVGQ